MPLYEIEIRSEKLASLFDEHGEAFCEDEARPSVDGSMISYEDDQDCIFGTVPKTINAAITNIANGLDDYIFHVVEDENDAATLTELAAQIKKRKKELIDDITYLWWSCNWYDDDGEIQSFEYKGSGRGKYTSSHD